MAVTDDLVLRRARAASSLREADRARRLASGVELGQRAPRPACPPTRNSTFAHAPVVAWPRPCSDQRRGSRCTRARAGLEEGEHRRLVGQDQRATIASPVSRSATASRSARARVVGVELQHALEAHLRLGVAAARSSSRSPRPSSWSISRALLLLLPDALDVLARLRQQVAGPRRSCGSAAASVRGASASSYCPPRRAPCPPASFCWRAGPRGRGQDALLGLLPALERARVAAASRSSDLVERELGLGGLAFLEQARRRRPGAAPAAAREPPASFASACAVRWRCCSCSRPPAACRGRGSWRAPRPWPARAAPRPRRPSCASSCARSSSRSHLAAAPARARAGRLARLCAVARGAS